MNSPFIMLRIALLIVCTALLPARNSALAQAMGTPPDSAGPTSTVHYVRHDVEGLKTLGGGDMIAGMNKLGTLSYDLFMVTTVNDQGAAGWFFFRQPPWNLPMERPKLEYRQYDDQAIVDLGNNSFNDGLTKLSNDGWQLAATTNAKNGGVGWYYFMREKPAANAAATPPVPVAPPAPMTPSAPPAPQNPLAAAATGDFSTPRAAVQTLIKAAAAKDADLISRCFAADAAEEFKPFRTKSASPEDLNEFARFFQGATVTADETQGSKASVTVKLASREEQIELSKSADGWKVVDF